MQMWSDVQLALFPVHACTKESVRLQTGSSSEDEHPACAAHADGMEQRAGADHVQDEAEGMQDIRKAVKRKHTLPGRLRKKLARTAQQ